MKILVVLAHPTPGSFNHAIARTCLETLEANGHEHVYHDLCAQGFDPDLPGPEIARGAELPDVVESHCRDLMRAEGIIVVHPNWWGMPPAIMAGWVDRVFRPGVAYEFLEGDSGEGVPHGLLAAESALVFNTSNTAEKREREVFGDPLERIWKDCVFDLCGVTKVHRRMFETIVTSTRGQREQWLREVADTVAVHYPANRT